MSRKKWKKGGGARFNLVSERKNVINSYVEYCPINWNEIWDWESKNNVSISIKRSCLAEIKQM